MKIGPFTPPDVREAILREQKEESFQNIECLPDFQLDIAGTRLLFESHMGVPLGSVDHRFLAPFLKFTRVEPAIQIHAIRVEENNSIPMDSIGNTIGTMSQQKWKITTPNWEIEWTQDQPNLLFCRYYKSLDSAIQAIRLFLAHRLLSQGKGLFLHASAALHQGKTYVFLGSSGAGKSTCAYHTPGLLLADETIALLSDPQGQIMALGTPFGGEHFPCATPGPNPVFLFVEKSDRNLRKPISTRNAVARLLSQIVLFPFAPLELWDQAAGWVEGILENHAVEILEAKKDGSFWKDCLS